MSEYIRFALHALRHPCRHPDIVIKMLRVVEVVEGDNIIPLNSRDLTFQIITARFAEPIFVFSINFFRFVQAGTGSLIALNAALPPGDLSFGAKAVRFSKTRSNFVE